MIKKIWDKLTDKFGRTIFHPQYFLKNYEYQAVHEIKKYTKHGTLIDIGCGRQPYKKAILPYVKKYIGVDHPQVSKKYETEDRPDILADALDIPLPNNYSDITAMISVLEHLPEPELAIKEAYRITKKGGVFVTITIQNYRLHDEPYDFFRYTKYGLKKIISSSGFKIVKVTPLGNYPILASQYLNAFMLYTVKGMFKSNLFVKSIAAILLPFIILISIVSNVIALFITKFGYKDKSGAFAIYNLAVAKKLS